ncbi:MAG: DUF2508 family protein [Clostridia bacterium]|nr:DUF2508 family protein [Clostridia bacterium]
MRRKMHMLFMRNKENQQDQRAEQVIKAMEQWQEARRYFESVSDTDLVDYAIYEAEAARRKYMLLLKRYAQERQQTE